MVGTPLSNDAAAAAGTMHAAETENHVDPVSTDACVALHWTPQELRRARQEALDEAHAG